jgi:hypothetical protein
MVASCQAICMLRKHSTRLHAAAWKDASYSTTIKTEAETLPLAFSRHSNARLPACLPLIKWHALFRIPCSWMCWRWARGLCEADWGRRSKKQPIGNIDIRCVTTGIRSEKCVVRRFLRCANVYSYTNLDSTVQPTTHPGYMI